MDKNGADQTRQHILAHGIEQDGGRPVVYVLPKIEVEQLSELLIFYRSQARIWRSRARIYRAASVVCFLFGLLAGFLAVAGSWGLPR